MHLPAAVATSHAHSSSIESRSRLPSSKLWLVNLGFSMCPIYWSETLQLSVLIHRDKGSLLLLIILRAAPSAAGPLDSACLRKQLRPRSNEQFKSQSWRCYFETSRFLLFVILGIEMCFRLLFLLGLVHCFY